MQLVIGHPGGQCVRACYASIFDLPIRSVPDFSSVGRPPGTTQIEAERAWLKTKGFDLKIVRQQRGQPPPRIPKNLYHMMSVEIPGTKVYGHRVVGRGGKVAHDPHPGGLPVVRVKAYLFIVPATGFEPATRRL